jgi:hypothetical protein
MHSDLDRTVAHLVANVRQRGSTLNQQRSAKLENNSKEIVSDTKNISLTAGQNVAPLNQPADVVQKGYWSRTGWTSQRQRAECCNVRNANASPNTGNRRFRKGNRAEFAESGDARFRIVRNRWARAPARALPSRTEALRERLPAD